MLHRGGVDFFAILCYGLRRRSSLEGGGPFSDDQKMRSQAIGLLQFFEAMQIAAGALFLSFMHGARALAASFGVR